MWLSHDKELCKIVNELNPYIFDLPDELVFKFFRGRVPRKARFLKWTKKEKVLKKTEKLIEELKEEHDLSTREARELLRSLQ